MEVPSLRVGPPYHDYLPPGATGHDLDRMYGAGGSQMYMLFLLVHSTIHNTIGVIHRGDIRLPLPGT